MYKKKEIIGNHFPKFDEMPLGWRFDATWGSSLVGYQPISNGKNMINGGKKGLLKVRTGEKKNNIPNIPKLKLPTIAQKPKPTKQEQDMCAIKVNDLARLKLKEQLIKDLTVDLMICKMEGWDYKEYAKDLKKTIDDICKSIVNFKHSESKRVDDAYRQKDLFV